MRERIANALESVAVGIVRLADRIRPQEDIGEGWWSLPEPLPLTKYDVNIAFTDKPNTITAEELADAITRGVERHRRAMGYEPEQIKQIVKERDDEREAALVADFGEGPPTNSEQQQEREVA